MLNRTIAVGCDPNASGLKAELIQYILTLGFNVEDFGSDDPIYANTAYRVATAVAEGKYERAILLCGTGLGMCLAANKVPGAYAVTCVDPYSTERSVKSNNVNILTMGSQVVGTELAKKIVDIWLKSDYETGGRSQPKINRIYEIEREFLKNTP
jgi:ribose 5-phosphate isomerase B